MCLVCVCLGAQKAQAARHPSRASGRALHAWRVWSPLRTTTRPLPALLQAAHGIRSLRLPIAEHAAALGMDEAGINARPVLNVSDVARALIDVYGGTPWPQALHMAVAQRKRKQQVEKPKRQRVANLGKAAAEQ